MSTPPVGVTMPVYDGMPLLAAAQVVFILSHLAAISALGLICSVHGRRALRGLSLDGLAAEIGLSTALGFGALGVFAFLLGMVGALTPPTIATLVLLLQLPFRPDRRRWRGRQTPERADPALSQASVTVRLAKTRSPALPLPDHLRARLALRRYYGRGP